MQACIDAAVAIIGALMPRLSVLSVEEAGGLISVSKLPGIGKSAVRTSACSLLSWLDRSEAPALARGGFTDATEAGIEVGCGCDVVFLVRGEGCAEDMDPETEEIREGAIVE